MTNATSNAAASGSNPTPQNPKAPTNHKRIVLKEIGSKWGKFSEQELSALKDNNDLVTQVVAKYSLDKVQAQRDVDALMKGRHI